MCLLTFFPIGVQPNLVDLAQGAENNPDGHGYAIATPDRIVMGHGLDDDDVIERFAVARRMYPDSPALFHSRIATAGKVTVRNCHPFHVGNDNRTVLAHNGILPASAQPFKWDGKRSDTRILAELLLPGGTVGSLRTRRGRQRICNWMGQLNKIVVLTVNPKYSKQAFLLNASQGEWHQGIWYSNDSYTEPWWRDAKYQTVFNGDWHYVKGADGKWTAVQGHAATADAWDNQAWRWDDDKPEKGTILGYPQNDAGDTCTFCRAAHALHPVTGMCSLCLTCNSCGQDEKACQCYVPKSAWRIADLEHAAERLMITGGDAEE